MNVESKVQGLLTDKTASFEVGKTFPAKDLDMLEKTLSNVRRRLCNSFGQVPNFEIVVPDFFLTKPLSEEQRRLVDNSLSGFYAERSVAQQEIIATVPIKESSEKMVSLPTLFQKFSLPLSLSDLPFNKACGEWAGKPRVFWVRESMAERLVKLAEAMSHVGLLFHIEDAFRPVGVQEGLFRRRVDWITTEHPDWDWQRVITEAKSKTAVSPRLASHKSGAAIDITLRKISDSLPLDLGNKYPEGGALVAIDCPFVTAEQWQTRQIFIKSFKMAGFSIYFGEDWHASYQDNLAGVSDNTPVEGYIAKYGPIKNFSLNTGEIIEIYDEKEYDTVFSDK